MPRGTQQQMTRGSQQQRRARQRWAFDGATSAANARVIAPLRHARVESSWHVPPTHADIVCMCVSASTPTMSDHNPSIIIAKPCVTHRGEGEDAVVLDAVLLCLLTLYIHCVERQLSFQVSLAEERSQVTTNAIRLMILLQSHQSGMCHSPRRGGRRGGTRRCASVPPCHTSWPSCRAGSG
jgi:hypothetical protein